MSIDKNDLTYIPSEIGNKERFINDGDSRIGGATKYCTCNTITGDPTVEGTHHDITCPMNPFYVEEVEIKCYLCGHIEEKQTTEEGHWYSNHYNTCSRYGVCAKCKANIGNGEPHKNSCIFTKCTCGNDGKPGPEHDPSCPKYVQPIYPTCEYCGKNGNDIKNHLIWCPNYDGLESYNTCVLCGENDGHKSTCVYGKKQAPKSDKMCTTEEVYDHLYKYFKSKKKIDNKEYCELTKTWKSFPSHAIQDIYIGSYNFEDIIRDNEQLFQLHQITYSLAPVYATLLIKTNNSRPDTVNQIEQRIIKFDYSYSTDWDLDVPVPTEEVFINLEVIYYNKARDKWLKHYTKQRLTPGNGSFSVTVNSNSDDVASFSSNWIQLKVNDKIINLNDPNIIPYNKQYDMHAAIEYIPDYTKPEVPPKYYRRYDIEVHLAFDSFNPYNHGDLLSRLKINTSNTSDNGLFNKIIGHKAAELSGYLQVDGLNYYWKSYIDNLVQFGEQTYTEAPFIWEDQMPPEKGTLVIENFYLYLGNAYGNNIIRTDIVNDNNELIAAKLNINMGSDGMGDIPINFITLDDVPPLTGDLTPIE